MAPTDKTQDSAARLIFVIGPAGAGRSTAINALEDIGYEVIHSLPISLLDRLLAGPAMDHPLAVGLDVRNRDFGVENLVHTIDRLSQDERIQMQLLFLDCSDDELVRRFSETRRRHPLAQQEGPVLGIEREKSLLVPLRARADFLIDTTGMTPHQLRRELEQIFAPSEGRILSVTVQSFSYKRGLPRGADFVFDCRSLRNLHWEPALRPLDGTKPRVADYVAGDPLSERFFSSIRELALAERLANALAAEDWQVSKRHRELERRADLAGTKKEPDA
jgi:UPF0042 nucleotide-binding protein